MAEWVEVVSRLNKRVAQLEAERQRLLEYGGLVETVLEAEECNGEKDDHNTTVTLHFSWFDRARALLAEGDRDGGSGS